MPVVQAECGFVAPAGAGNVFTHMVRMIPGRRLHDHQRVPVPTRRRAVVAHGRAVRVLSDLDMLRPVPIPPHVRQALKGGDRT